MAHLWRGRRSAGVVRQGGVVVHHSRALHSSGPNHSDRWRRAYATHWITPRVRLNDQTKKIAYCLRDDYPNLQ